MRLVKTTPVLSDLEDEFSQADKIIKQINELVSTDETGEQLVAAQKLISECRTIVSQLAERVSSLVLSSDSKKIVTTSNCLKAQSRLVIASGLATRHISKHLRLQAEGLKRSTQRFKEI